MSTPFTRELGTRQGRIVPAGTTPADGSHVMCFGFDEALHMESFNVGDYVQISQTAEFAAGTKLLRVVGDVREPQITLPGTLAWRLGLWIDGTLHAAHLIRGGGRTRRRHLAANVSKLGAGNHAVTLRLELRDTSVPDGVFLSPTPVGSAELFGGMRADLNVLSAGFGGEVIGALEVTGIVDPATIPLTSYLRVEDFNLGTDAWPHTASAAPNVSGGRAQVTVGRAHTSTVSVNGFTLPAVSSPTDGLWSRLQGASGGGFTQTVTDYMFTQLLYITQDDVTPFLDDNGGLNNVFISNLMFSHRSWYYESNGDFFGVLSRDTTGQMSVVVGGQINTVSGPGTGVWGSPSARVPMNAAAVVQGGIKTIGGVKHLCTRSSFDNRGWRTVALPADTSTYYYAPANHHLGYSGGGAAKYFPGAYGDCYQTSGVVLESVHDALFDAMKAKFAVL